MKNNILLARDILVAPHQFFESHKGTSIRQSTKYLLLLLVISFILQTISVIVVQPMFNRLFETIVQMPVATGEINPAFIIPSFVNSVLVGFLISFLVAFILHIWLKLFSKDIVWQKSFFVYVFSQTPIFLLSWLPIINSLAWIYSIYLLVVGVRHTHEIDKRAAIVVIVLPIALLFIVSSVVMLIAFSSLK